MEAALRRAATGEPSPAARRAVCPPFMRSLTTSLSREHHRRESDQNRAVWRSAEGRSDSRGAPCSSSHGSRGAERR
jgi:hypothetical protein